MRTVSLAAIFALAAAPIAAQQAGTMDNSVYKIQDESRQPATASQEKLRRALEEAGFRQVVIVNAAYVVRAKTEDGDDVVMHVVDAAPPEQRNGTREPDGSFDTDSIYTVDQEKGGANSGASETDSER